MLLPQHHLLHSVITAVQGHHRTQDRCTNTELSTTKELCPCSTDGLGGVSRCHVWQAGKSHKQNEPILQYPYCKRLEATWFQQHPPSPQLPVTLFCRSGQLRQLEQPQALSLWRFSALYSSSTGRSSTGHMQLVTFSNVEAMNRLGITQTSFLSSPPQFNTTFTVSSHSPSQTSETWVLSKGSVARANQMHVQVCYLYIHKKIESLANTQFWGETCLIQKTKIQLFLHILCAGVQRVKPLHTSPSMCTKPLWIQVPSTSPCQDLLHKAKKCRGSIHPPLFLCSSLLQSFYLVFLHRREGRAHTAFTRKWTTLKQASKRQGDKYSVLWRSKKV